MNSVAGTTVRVIRLSPTSPTDQAEVAVDRLSNRAAVDRLPVLFRAVCRVSLYSELINLWIRLSGSLPINSTPRFLRDAMSIGHPPGGRGTVQERLFLMLKPDSRQNSIRKVSDGRKCHTSLSREGEQKWSSRPGLSTFAFVRVNLPTKVL